MADDEEGGDGEDDEDSDHRFSLEEIMGEHHAIEYPSAPPLSMLLQHQQAEEEASIAAAAAAAAVAAAEIAAAAAAADEAAAAAAAASAAAAAEATAANTAAPMSEDSLTETAAVVSDPGMHPLHEHVLKKTDSTESGFLSHSCNQCYASGLNLVHRCASCDFDLCEDCFGRRETVPAPSLVVGGRSTKV